MEGEREARIGELKKEIEDLKKRLSAHRHKACATHIVHSDPPELWMKIEELEDELRDLEKGKE